MPLSRRNSEIRPNPARMRVVVALAAEAQGSLVGVTSLFHSLPGL
jgi:hypothetical protein